MYYESFIVKKSLKTDV